MKKITKKLVHNFVSENEIKLNCTHQKSCVPIIDRIYKKMLKGIRFNEIRVADGRICDGHY